MIFLWWEALRLSQHSTYFYTENGYTKNEFRFKLQCNCVADVLLVQCQHQHISIQISSIHSWFWWWSVMAHKSLYIDVELIGSGFDPFIFTHLAFKDINTRKLKASKIQVVWWIASQLEPLKREWHACNMYIVST